MIRVKEILAIVFQVGNSQKLESMWQNVRENEHKTFKGFTNVSKKLDGRKYFIMADGGKLIAKVPLKWKKSFRQGVVIPHKMKNCSDCKIDSLCDRCDKFVHQRKEFSVSLNELKREVPNEYGQMLSKYIIT